MFFIVNCKKGAAYVPYPDAHDIGSFGAAPMSGGCISVEELQPA
jgi:hypothetical protein